MRGFRWFYPLAVTLLAGCGDDEPVANPEVTFYRDILPLAHQHCSGCHASGAGAWAWPEDAELAKEYSAEIAAAVSLRIMPPWLPNDDACEPIAGSRELDEREIAVFERWDAIGAPLGDPQQAPPPTKATPRGLPRADVEMVTAPYVPAPGSDDYHCTLVDPGLTATRDLVGIEIAPLPETRAHHVVAFAIDPSMRQKLPADAETKGWDCETSVGVQWTALLGTWVLGTPAARFPAGTGIRIGGGNLIVLETHYRGATNQDDPAAPERTTLRFEYAPEPVSRPATIVPLANYFFEIPPHAKDFELSYERDTTSLGAALENGGTIWGMAPHQHGLGNRIGVERVSGAGEQCLLDVPRWDDRWQEYFFYANPAGVRVEAGDTLRLACSWDNPRDEAVSFGRTARDEMCTSYMYVTE
jgi:hypothetical protein